MTPTAGGPWSEHPLAPAQGEDSGDDPRLAEALQEYLTALEAGRKPSRREFLARHPAIAVALGPCLDALELMHAAAPHPQGPPSGAAGPGASLAGLHGGMPLGDFRLVREVGRGGMGVVYEAQQLSLGRRVALKVLPLAATMDPRQLQRFHNEARAAACLDHPNVVKVYAVGSERGVHYYAMQLIDGLTLAEWVARQRPSAPAQAERKVGSPSVTASAEQTTAYTPSRPLAHTTPEAAASTASAPRDASYYRRVAEWALQAAEALEHAHGLGIVHRDVKPGNLMIDGHGKLWVTDFGLARLQGRETALTMTGDLLGTLRYMSPEQALARHGLVDHRTDVYSLGATLYELLALEPAFPSNDRQELLRQIAFEDPEPLRRLARGVPAELETITHKAMAKEPAERYATASELADDLARFLNDQPIRARPPTAAQRAWKWARRHRPLVVSLALSLALLFGGSILALVGYAVEQRHLAQEAGLLAQEREEFGRQQEKERLKTAKEYRRTLLEGADVLTRARQPHYRALVWENLRKAVQQDVPGADPGEIKDRVLACLGDLVGLEPVKPPPAPRQVHPPPLRRVHQREVDKFPPGRCVYAVSPDGRLLAAGLTPGPLTLWDSAGNQGPSSAAPLGGIYTLQFTPDGQHLVGGCEGGVVIWAVPAMWPLAQLRGGSAYSVAVHRNGKLLAFAGRQLELWSLTTNRPVATLPWPSGAKAAFSEDGKLLLALVGEKVVGAWTVSGTPEKLYLDGHREGVPGLAFSPDGARLASGSKDRSVRIWDARTGALHKVLKGHGAAIEAVAFSPAGGLLASGDYGGQIILWDAQKGQELARVGDLFAPGQVWRLQFTTGARGHFLVAGAAQRVMAWAVRDQDGRVSLEPALSLRVPQTLDIAVHPDGTALAFLTREGKLYSYDLENGGAPRLLARCTAQPRSLSFDDSGRLVFLSAGGEPATWDWRQGRQACAVGRKAFHLALRGDRWLAGTTADQRVFLGDLQTGGEVLTLPAEASEVWSLAWSPDGARLAVGLSDGGLAVWELEEVRARLAEFNIRVPSTADGPQARRGVDESERMVRHDRVAWWGRLPFTGSKSKRLSCPS